MAPGAAVFVPNDITVATDPGQAGAVVQFTATGVDDDDSPLDPTCAPQAGSFFPIGTTTVNCMVTSFNGREASDSFTVTVVDDEDPVLSLPGDMQVQASGPDGATITYTASATDNSGSATVSCAPTSGSTFALGTTTVNCSATDPSNNSASGSFTVTVTAPDEVAPGLTLPANIVVPAQGASGAVVTYTTSATMMGA